MTVCESSRSKQPLAGMRPLLQSFRPVTRPAGVAFGWLRGMIRAWHTRTAAYPPPNTDRPLSSPIDIDVWTWSLAPPPAVLARLARTLNAEEEARASRFLNPLHGDHYRAGRGRLREILAAVIGDDPAALMFATGTAGKPALLGVTDAPAFNLSHTDDFAALAVCRTPIAALGVDIERIRPIERDVARRFFSPGEVAVLEALPAEGRTEAFYRCWTRKEAFVKATGDGLGFPLDAFDVSLATEAPALLRLEGRPADHVARWRMIHLSQADLTVGVIGALAVERASADVEVAVHKHDRLEE
jgi:4'-phosphopantetheinyl transferase